MDFKEFGQTIATLRKEQNISQKELAEDIGYTIDLKKKTQFPIFEELRDAR